MLKKQSLLLLFFFTISIITFGQRLNIDSLEQVIPTLKNDSIKLRTMSKLGWYYADRNFDKSMQKANEMLAVAVPIDAHSEIGNAYNMMGYNYDAQGLELEKIIEYFEKSIEYGSIYSK